MTISYNSILVLVFLVSLLGCDGSGGGIPDGGDDAGTDDAGTDTDTDTDTDADTDTCGEVSCAEPCVRYVDGDASASGDGAGWDTAFQRVQAGIDAAACAVAACDTTCQVWVRAGTYYVFEESADDTVGLAPGVALYGGFAGGETALEQRDWEANETILDGRDGPEGMAAVKHVVIASDDATIDGFTVTHGVAVGCGGGLLASGCSPSVANCAFVANQASAGGGAICSVGGSPSISGCAFSDNSSEDLGGAVRAEDGSPVISSSTFDENQGATGGGAAFYDCTGAQVLDSHFAGNVAALNGGGLFFYGGSTNLVSGISFESNSTEVGSGGAVWLNTDDVSFVGCSFSGNSANYGAGALGLYDSTAEVEACGFTGNSTVGTGGALAAISSEVAIRDSVFDSNTAADTQGGAIDVNGAEAHVENSVFTGNEAVFGGAISAADASPSIINCAFSGNAATHGGALVSAFAISLPEVTNCVLWGNTPDEIYDMENAVTTVTYSDVQGGWTGAGNIDADPLFADADAGVLELSASSPCIDAANGDVAPDLDIDGNARVDDPATVNTGVGTPAYVDMGAYEYQP